MEVSIKSLYINKVGIDNVSQDFYNMLNNNHVSTGILKSTKTKNINLMYQIGGILKKADLNGINYEYHISEIIPYGSNQKMINFLTIDEINEYCATIIYDKKDFGTQMILQGIFNGDDCIKCLVSNIEYKVGDILMKIIIKLTSEHKNYSHIKTIKLIDNSLIAYGDLSIKLLYLRTITHGIPYYAKFGFRPESDVNCERGEIGEIGEIGEGDEVIKVGECNKVDNNDYQVFKYNRTLFKQHPIINIDVLTNLINEKLTKIEIEMFNKYFSYKLNKYKMIKANELITLLMDKYNLYKKSIEICNEKIECKVMINEQKYIFNIIYKLYKHIYKLIGYKTYFKKTWVLKIRN